MLTLYIILGIIGNVLGRAQQKRKKPRPLGQAVKTPPFHGGNRGSIPLGVTILYGSIAQLGEHLPYKQRVTGSIPVVSTILKYNICWHGSTVEQLTCNQQVVGSIPIASSTNGGVPERPKGADCKSVTFRFDGSNPSSSTIRYNLLIILFCYILFFIFQKNIY